jgi:hypothetical protein
MLQVKKVPLFRRAPPGPWRHPSPSRPCRGPSSWLSRHSWTPKQARSHLIGQATVLEHLGMQGIIMVVMSPLLEYLEMVSRLERS